MAEVRGEKGGTLNECTPYAEVGGDDMDRCFFLGQQLSDAWSAVILRKEGCNIHTSLRRYFS